MRVTLHTQTTETSLPGLYSVFILQPNLICSAKFALLCSLLSIAGSFFFTRFHLDHGLNCNFFRQRFFVCKVMMLVIIAVSK